MSALDLTRGKPSAEQLSLSDPLLHLPGDDYRAEDGTDTRNYGGLDGLPELRRIFAGPLQVDVDRLLALGNSSLEVMYDVIAYALLDGVPGGSRRWVEEPGAAVVCPTPGYDRHFALCERLGLDLIGVPMTADGPDVEAVSHVVADPRVKAMWCMPKYSNPDATVYSDEVVQALASMPTGASDFRLLWDNAYAVHHLTAEEVQIADVLAACADAGNPDRALVFGSTSKITHAGSGVAFLGASAANLDWYRANAGKRSIGPDKVNQLRHARFLRDTDGLRAHMARHREILAPRFALVQQVLTDRLGGRELATWTSPRGGYFVTLRLHRGGASEVVAAAAAEDLKLTPAGATHPYGHDPHDATLRLAPTFPGLDELEQALDLLTGIIMARA